MRGRAVITLLGGALALLVALPAGGQTQQQQRASIDWGAAQRDQAAQARQANQVTAARTQPPAPRNARPQDLQAVTLPVLIPVLPGARTALAGGEAGMLVFPNEDFYAASMVIDGLLVEAFGTRLANAQISEPIAARRLQGGRDAEGFAVTATESGQTVDFTRYGAAYSVTLECEDPEADPRCTDPDFAKSIARSMVIAGGSPEGSQ